MSSAIKVLFRDSSPIGNIKIVFFMPSGCAGMRGDFGFAFNGGFFFFIVSPVGL